MWFLVFINSFISVGYDVNRGAAFAPLVLPRPSEKVQLSLKNQCLQRFLRPESSEVVR